MAIFKPGKLFRHSPLLWLKDQKFPSYRFRDLTQEEIETLENQQNTCEDWSQVKVQNTFNPSAVRNCCFLGSIQLPEFFGTVRTAGGITLPAGLYNCTIHNSIVENSCLRDVSLISHTVINQGVVVQNVGSIVCGGTTTYGVGRPIVTGSEKGGRTIRCFPEMETELLEKLLLDRSDKEFLQTYETALKTHLQAVSNNWTYIGTGASVCNSNIIRNSWIGPWAKIDGAAKIRGCFLHSTLDQPAEIYDGVILEHTIAKEGVKVHSQSQVKNSFLLNGSSCGKKAMVSESVIGSQCKVEEAEVTSSYTGPLTQLHHHSLLISALWPEGKGNVGYGANVGSNHTGRLPDQEIRPGEGTFFGLGTSIKFPANFSESPYSIIATGVTTLPQRLRFPFSLINSPATQNPLIPRQFNELLPGWCYGHNSFALMRNQFKYSQREKGRERSKQGQQPHSILRTDIARLVLAARNALKDIERVQEIYTEKDIPGLGKNYLTEPNRSQALEFYEEYLKRFLVQQALQPFFDSLEGEREIFESSKPLFAGDLREFRKQISVPDTLPSLVKLHRTQEKHWKESVLSNSEKDCRRGEKIFDDYALVHPEDESLMQYIEDSFNDVRLNCNLLLKSIRESTRKDGNSNT